MEQPEIVHSQPRQRQIVRWVLVGALLLFGGGITMAYFIYSDLEKTYQELQTAYTDQQDENNKLAQKSEELFKVVEKTQAQVKSLKKRERATEKERGKLEAKGRKLETNLNKLKPAYIAEQARTKNLTKEADELSKALEDAEARMRDLQESQGITEQVKGKLEGKVLKLETAMKVLQKAYIAEQVKTRKLTQKAKELSRAVEQAKGRGKVPGQPPAQLKAMKQAQGPGKDVNQLADRLKEMEQVRAQVDALEKGREASEQEKGKEESQASSEQEKGKLEANGTKLEAALENIQKAYDAEQAKTERFIDERAEMIGLVIRLRSEMVTLHHTIGINYTNLGKNEEALKAFLMALKLNPNHAESHFELARLYMEYLGDKESAVAHFRRYVRLRPEANNAERIKGWLLRTETELRAKKDQRNWGTGSSRAKSLF